MLRPTRRSREVLSSRVGTRILRGHRHDHAAAEGAAAVGLAHLDQDRGHNLAILDRAPLDCQRDGLQLVPGHADRPRELQEQGRVQGEAQDLDAGQLYAVNVGEALVEQPKLLDAVGRRHAGDERLGEVDPAVAGLQVLHRTVAAGGRLDCGLPGGARDHDSGLGDHVGRLDLDGDGGHDPAVGRVRAAVLGDQDPVHGVAGLLAQDRALELQVLLELHASTIPPPGATGRSRTPEFPDPGLHRQHEQGTPCQ